MTGDEGLRLKTLEPQMIGGEKPAGWIARSKHLTAKGRRPFVFTALLVFTALYYYRPEDFILALAYVPMAKVTAIIAAIALFIGTMGGGKNKVPVAIKILWLLLIQMTMCIPFALWRGGAFSTVFEKFAKGVIVAMLVSLTVVTVRELRKLFWIQVSAVAFVTLFSIALRHYNAGGRLHGIQRGILENPNDLAINIAISFPLAMAFMLQARGIKKAVWIAGLAVMSLGIVLTYSRSGLVAFILSIMVCVWEYGIKGRRRHIVVIAGLMLVLGLGIALSTSHYRMRVESIVMGNIEGSGDKGSLEARKELLKKSLMVALRHPVFGVGPGCFPLVDSGWVVAHNSYTELAAEAGFPALLLFLLVIRYAFKNLARVRKSEWYDRDLEFRLYTQAIRAGLAAYLLGACFASIEYNLYPYFIVGYTCAMAGIITRPFPGDAQPSRDRNLTRANYGVIRKPQTVWNR